MSTTPNYYAVIPANVRYSKEIPDGAKLLYGEITALCNQHGYCWATNAYFSELYRASERTVSRWISELARAGFILTLVDRDGGNGRKIWLAETQGAIDKNVYRVATKMSKGYGQKCREAIDKNVVQNNTVNNTLNNTEEEEAIRKNSSTSAKLENIISTLKAEKKETPPPPTPAAPLGTVGFVDPAAEVQRMRTDTAAREVFTRTRQIPAHLYEEYLTDFALEMSATTEPHFGVAKFRNHFFNWAAKRYQIAQDRKPQASATNRPSIRAGS